MSDYADLCEFMGQDPSDPDAIDHMIDMAHGGDDDDDDDDDFEDDDFEDDDELIQTDEELEDEAASS